MKGMVVGDNGPVAERSTWTHRVNRRFVRNTLLANTALVLLCQIGVLVLPSRCRKLFGCQTYLHWIPKIALPLS